MWFAALIWERVMCVVAKGPRRSSVDSRHLGRAQSRKPMSNWTEREWLLSQTAREFRLVLVFQQWAWFCSSLLLAALIFLRWSDKNCIQAVWIHGGLSPHCLFLCTSLRPRPGSLYLLYSLIFQTDWFNLALASDWIALPGLWLTLTICSNPLSPSHSLPRSGFTCV